MVNKLNLDCFDEFTSRFIRAKVRQLIGRAGIRECEREDLIQDFVLDLIQRSESFDPSTATWQAFVVVVCENKCAAVLAHRKAAMRSRDREAGSLNHTGGKRADIGSTLADSQQEIRTGQRRRPHAEASELVQDVANVLDQLPPLLRDLCERLKHGSISEVARELKTSPKTLYRRIAQLRQRFERADLRDYL